MKKTDKGFTRLLRRYQEGTCSEEEKAILDQWFNSVHHEIADQPLGDNRDAIMKRMWASIQSTKDGEIDLPSARYRKTWWQLWPIRAAVACLLLLSGFAAYRFLATSDQSAFVSTTGNISEQTELRNELSSPKLVKLPDNSSVTLDPGSVVTYHSDFGLVNRKIRLSGSGFFEVSHDPSKPFFVFADKIVTQVVGTSFTVRHHGGDLEVAVLTGKVRVGKFAGAMDDKNSLSAYTELTPNQKITYDPKRDHFLTGLTNNPIRAKNSHNDLNINTFNFENTPLSEVAGVLESAYGITIEIKNEKIRSCPVKADLKGQTLYTKLDIICAALNSHYDIKGKTVVITGGQCE